ncbi:calymmin [Oryzias melastigma]|uniref:calymmin n=1 Tax=Oryzias melastigma TaxID=30732 RepID=UPI00168D3A3A|nr:calymmin [Oryzias melastigma]
MRPSCSGSTPHFRSSPSASRRSCWLAVSLRPTMVRRRCLLILGATILWLVQAVHSGGYGVSSGVSNGAALQNNGYKPQNNRGVGSLLMPSKGVGHTGRPQNGYAGYPTKGVGYGATAGMNKGVGMKGYGQAAEQMSGRGGKQLGYGAQAGGYGATKGNGYEAAAASQYTPGARGNGRNPAVFFNRNGAQPNAGYGVSAGPLSGGQIKGYGAQAGGYGATKGNGYEAAAASQYTPGARGNGYGPKAGPSIRQQLKSGYVAQTGGQGGKPNGYGVVAGPSTGQQMRNGYASQSGGQMTKGNGNVAAATTQNGLGTKGQGVVAGPSTGNGAYGQGGVGSKPMKGYGRTPYGTGVQRGVLGGLGVPQPTRNQQKPYGSKSGYRAQPNGGYNGGYGSAALGPRYGNGGIKGPAQGYANFQPRPGNGAVLSGYEQQGGGVAAKPAKSGVGNIPTGYGGRPNGYPQSNGGSGRLQPGYGATAGGGVFKGYGAKPIGQGGNGAVLSGYGRQPNGYNMMPNGKGQAVRGAEVSGRNPLKGGMHFHHHHHQQQQMTAQLGDVTPRVDTPPAPAPTNGLLVMVTQDKYQKLPSPLPQGKKYKHTPLHPEETPEPAPAYPEARGQHLSLEPAPIGPKDKNQKGVLSGPAAVVPQGIPSPEHAESGGSSVSKGPGAKLDCGLSDQWMKIPRPDYNAAAGSLDGSQTKGVVAGANAYPNNGYGAGLGYPYAGKTAQAGESRFNLNLSKNERKDVNFSNLISKGYGQGVHPGAGYDNGNQYGGNVVLSEAGYRNGFGAGPQPDYSSYGQSVSTTDGKSGGNPRLPAGLDGMTQFEPRSVGLGANVKGGMYGVGGLQFGGQPVNSGINGGQYGYGGSSYGPASDGKSPGKYGGTVASMGGNPVPGKQSYGGYPYNQNAQRNHAHGRLPYGVQQAGLNSEAKAAGHYGHAGSSYQPESAGFGQKGKTSGPYSGGQAAFTPQSLGFGDKQGAFQSQLLGPAAEEAAGQSYERGLDSAGKSYVKGEVPTAALAAESGRIPMNKYENVGYINGQVQSEVAALPAAPTAGSTLAFSSPDAIPPEDVQDIPDPEGTASFLESAPVTEMLGESQVPEDDENLPRQIHIQQHLKLHFNPQSKKDGKYDVNGFFGNNGY